MKTHFLLLTVLCALVSHSAQAFSVSAVGGLDWANPNQTTTRANRSFENSSGSGYAFGALLSLGAFPGFEAEIGALYMQNKYKNAIIVSGTRLVDNEVQFKSYHFPLLLRFTPIPVFSVGAGVFYEIGAGDIDAKDSISNTTSITTFASQDISNKNYGLSFDARAAYPLAPTLSLILDLRYNLGLKNLNTDPSSFKTKNILALLGVSFGL